MNPEKVTLELPRKLHEHIQEMIQGSKFSSVEDFVVFVLRDILYEGQEERPEDLTPYEVRRIKDKLKILGYL